MINLVCLLSLTSSRFCFVQSSVAYQTLRCADHSSSPKKRKSTGPHQPAAPPTRFAETSSTPSATSASRRSHARQRSDISDHRPGAGASRPRCAAVAATAAAAERRSVTPSRTAGTPARRRRRREARRPPAPNSSSSSSNRTGGGAPSSSSSSNRTGGGAPSSRTTGARAPSGRGRRRRRRRRSHRPSSSRPQQPQRSNTSSTSTRSSSTSTQQHALQPNTHPQAPAPPAHPRAAPSSRRTPRETAAGTTAAGSRRSRWAGRRPARTSRCKSGEKEESAGRKRGRAP